MGITPAARILGRLGDPNRFDNLAGIRSFTGLVPKINQSGTSILLGGDGDDYIWGGDGGRYGGLGQDHLWNGSDAYDQPIP